MATLDEKMKLIEELESHIEEGLSSGVGDSHEIIDNLSAMYEEEGETL